eukprot:CAMPEP_0170562742 /NCGR_PEP_ID=MMETSP0211-20121228/62260_1 /TAXON_ID=311385 /ORGANISM="Pseudokeronopsis sp., Strain OXSARD2" /LENGTH=121 /DNA_ID=CAMNT_0010880041 /DNA_START=74 /DNA_END=439 /DNA_ORIENTATION=-
MTTANELFELDELNDIPGSSFSLAVPQHILITIKLFHCFELFFAYANYDDAQRQVGSFDNGVFGLIHVVDLSISQYQKNVVAHLVESGLYNSHHLLKDRVEVSWSRELYSWECLPVGLKDA